VFSQLYDRATELARKYHINHVVSCLTVGCMLCFAHMVSLTQPRFLAESIVVQFTQLDLKRKVQV